MKSGEIDKGQIAHCFRQSMSTYNKEATVQRQVGSRLLALAGEFPAISYERVLEIGCCTGMLTQMLCAQKPVGALFLNDLVAEFFPSVMAGVPVERRPVLYPCFGDIETLPLPQDLSLVVSSSTFQWLADLPQFFHSLSRSLQAGGFLVFSLFGPGTLAEFRELTGVGLEYRGSEEIGKLLARDFIVKRVVEERMSFFLPNPRAVLHHLRATGVGGVREYRWTKAGLKRFEQEYRARFGGVDGVPVSFVTISCIACKPMSLT